MNGKTSSNLIVIIENTSWSLIGRNRKQSAPDLFHKVGSLYWQRWKRKLPFALRAIIAFYSTCTLLYVQRTLCAADCMYSGLYVQRTLCAADFMYSGHYVQLTFCTADIMYSGHYVQRTLCTADIMCSGHYVHCTSDIMCSGHYVQRTFCTLYSGLYVQWTFMSYHLLFTNYKLLNASYQR